jgi:cellulase/cellobiase CelA1
VAGESTTIFTTVSLTAATHYSFAVAAVDTAGAWSGSAFSNWVNVDNTQPPPAYDPPCSVSYKYTEWPGGFQAQVTITNAEPYSLSSWTLQLPFGGDQQVKYTWSASSSQDAQLLTLANLPWNAVIPRYGSVTFGFGGSWASSDAVPGPVFLNGQLCASVSSQG